MGFSAAGLTATAGAFTAGLAAGLAAAVLTGFGLGLAASGRLGARSFRVVPTISSSGLLRPLRATRRSIGMP